MNVYFPAKKGEKIKKFSVRHAIEHGFLGKGSYVKPLIKFVGVWLLTSDRMSVQWSLEQLLITRTSDEHRKKNAKCPILNDNE